MTRLADDTELALLHDAAIEAGALAMHWFADPGQVTDKGDNHPVTKADLAVDQLLRERLLSARNSYGWLSEETVDDRSRLRAKRVFVVDPIDGTRAFIRGEPHFVVSLAIVEQGLPVAAAVFNPALDEMFLAAKGKGASLNGKPIHMRKCEELTNCKMIAHSGLFRQKHWHRGWPDMQLGVRNAMAYRMVLVAAGKWDGTMTLRPKSDWDLAAADLIATEAGGVVTDPAGADFLYNLPDTHKSGVICAGTKVHALIRERIVESEQDRSQHGQERRKT